MSNDYTSSEVEAAVRKLVQGTVRRGYGSLGNRDHGTEFNDLQDAAAGVFATTPAAVFYVILLGVGRTLEALASEVAAADAFVAAATAAGRYAPPLRSISSLANANAALQDLEGASSARSDAFADITSVPAYKRYLENTDKFLRAAAVGIRVGASISFSPQEAQEQLAPLLQALEAAHADFLQRVNYLVQALADYTALNLGGLLSAGVIANARQVLQSRLTELSALTDDDRNKVLRDVSLDVMAGRAAVTGFGSLTLPTTFVPLEGPGGAYADATHLALSAVLRSEFAGPYAIVGPYLVLELDSGPSLNLQLQAGYVASLDGVVDSSFDIYGPFNPPPTGFFDCYSFVVELPGFTTYSASLSQASARPVESVVAELNAAVTTQPIEFVSKHRSARYSGVVNVLAVGALNPGGADVTFVLPGNSWLTLGVLVGYTIAIQQTGSPNDLLVLTVASLTASTLFCTFTSGPTPVNESVVYAEVGAAPRHIQLRIKASAASAALAARQLVRLPLGVTAQAFTALGFPEGAELRCRRVPAADLAAGITSSFAASYQGVPRVRADAVFVASLALRGRTDPRRTTALIVYSWGGKGAVSAGTFVLVTGLSTTDGDLAEVSVGDKLVLRTADVSADVGRVGTVTLVSSTSLQVAFSSAISATASAELEIAPATALQEEQTIRVLLGSPLAGDYLVDAIGDFPGDATLTRALPLYQNVGGRPFFFDVQVGAFHVDFTSLSAGLDSRVRAVGGTAYAQLFSPAPQDATGTTAFVKVPRASKSIEETDLLELYLSGALTPDTQHAIVGLELSAKLIEVDPPISSTLTTLNYSTVSQVPFARIRKTLNNSYRELESGLKSWLAYPVNQPPYFRELGRLLNQLLSSSNPTAVQVSAVKAQVALLTEALGVVETVLENYDATAVSRVDVLLTSFRQKGADRAIDMLLSCRFQEFFGLTVDGVSYLGATLEQLRDVQRTDLPIRKSHRKEAVQNAVIRASYEETDAEFDFSDAQESDEPDIPGMYSNPGPGNVY